MGRVGRRALAGAVIACVTCAAWLTGPAAASLNTAPSTAANVAIGVPFTGSWAGTPYTSGRGYTHWWRLPAPLRAGDQVQIAIDNRTGPEIEACLIPPVDDFGADDAVSDCDFSYVSGGVQDRRVFDYGLTTGQPFLVLRYDCFCEDDELRGTYTITLERIVSLVNVGLVVPSSLPTTFTLTANLTNGDNTPAGDGIPVSLQWRYASSGDAPFAEVVTGVSGGGTVTFSGTMPAAAEGSEVDLRACVPQPGGDSVRCSGSSRTTVAVSACTSALNGLLGFSRSVNRTMRRLQRARARRARVAQRRLRRSLRAKKHRLAAAQRAVDAYC
jgi:hypothetical protein